MDEENNSARNDEFVVVTPEEPAPVLNEERLHADGHGNRPRREFLETRERLSAVEQQVSQVGKVVSRVEAKVETVHDDVQSVEENALDKEYFENQYKGTIETNDSVVSILVWGGGVLLALVGAFATLYSAGVL